MRYAVFGAGSMGSLFAGRLAGSGADVTLVGRGEHFETVREDGVTLVEPAGGRLSVAVTTARNASDVGAVDAVFLCVKAYDTAAALADLQPLLDAKTDVITFQNGLGNAETIASAVSGDRVAVGTTSHGAYVESPGVVVHAGAGDTVIGRFDAPNDDRVDAYASDLTDAGIVTAVTDDPARAVWEKVLVNAGINPATALADVPNGDLVDGPGERVLASAVREGARVANAEGVDIDADDAVAAAREVAEVTAPNASSMRQDLERGRQTEIEALNGEIVRRGDAHEIPTPTNRTLADLVRLASPSADAEPNGEPGSE